MRLLVAYRDQTLGERPKPLPQKSSPREQSAHLGRAQQPDLSHEPLGRGIVMRRAAPAEPSSLD